MKARWTPIAGDHLQAAFDYLARDRPHAATASVARVLHAVETMERHPRMGRAGRVPGTRELVVTGTPLIVAYRVQPTAIEILAVLHGARRWPDRLQDGTGRRN